MAKIFTKTACNPVTKKAVEHLNTITKTSNLDIGGVII